MDSSLESATDFIRVGASLMGEAEERGDIFFGHGTDNGLDESIRLVLATLHLPPECPDTLLNGKLLESEKEAIQDNLRLRIADRIPLPYIVNRAQFMGLSFYVDEQVLIPRSPIGELIEGHFSPWLTTAERILEIGCGSGCIAIACAYEFPEATVDAVDISNAALQVAQVNVDRHGLANQVRLLQSDLFSALTLDGSAERYNLIVSNPPYVDRADLDEMPAEFRAEPMLALEAGEDGLDLVVRVLSEAAAHLEDDGLLVVEVGNSQLALQQLFPDVSWIWMEFEQGGDGVFALGKDLLLTHHKEFQVEAERRR